MKPAISDPGQKRNTTNTAELIIVEVNDAIAAVPDKSFVINNDMKVATYIANTNLYGIEEVTFPRYFQK